MIYFKTGLIPLNLAYDDEIVQEANGLYQLTFKFPADDDLREQLVPETLLLADDLHGEQEFFVFEVKKSLDHVTVYANQVATLLNSYAINKISVDRVPGQTVMTALAGAVVRTCPFSFASDVMSRHTLNISHVSVMDALAKGKHSIIGQWGGDLVRDKYSIRLLANGGAENQSLFMYRKNLSQFEQERSIKDLRTRIHFRKVIKGEEGTSDQTLAVTVDSPLIGQYSQIYEATMTVEDQDVTDVASLRAYGQAYYGKTLCDLPEESMELAVVGEPDTPVRLYDVVSVLHESYGVDLRLKLSKYRYAPMAKRLKSIGFGKVNQTLGGMVGKLVDDQISEAHAALSDEFDHKLQKEIDNANAAFDAEFDKAKQAIDDGIEEAKAAAEVVKAEVSQAVSAAEAKANQALAGLQDSNQRSTEALNRAGASSNLAETARQLAAEAKANLGNLRSQVDAQARELGTKITHDEVMQRVGTTLNGYVPNSTFELYQTQSAQALTTWQRETREMIPTKVDTVNLVRNSKISESSSAYGFGPRNVYLEAGKKYQFVARAKKTGGTPDKTTRVYLYNESWSSFDWLEFTSTEYAVVAKVFVPRETGIYHFTSYWFPRGGDRSGTADVDWYMVVESDIAPQHWSPHPDDLAGKTDLANYVQTSTFDRYQRETAEGLERRFTETKALIPRQIGGRNYLKNSNFVDGLKHWHSNSGNPQMLIRQDTDFKTSLGRDGTVWLYSNGLTPFGNGIYQVVQGQFRTGTSITLSFDAIGGYNNTSGLLVVVNNHQFDRRQTISADKIGAVGDFTTTRLIRHQLTFDIPIDTDTINLIIIFDNDQPGAVGNVVLTDVMLEDGKIASSHVIAPSEQVTTVDFQQVRETARLYERVLGRTEGEVATNLARQVMTSELMQNEIRKIPTSIGGTNLLVNSTFTEDTQRWLINGSAQRLTTPYPHHRFTGQFGTTLFALQNITDKIKQDPDNQVYTYSLEVKVENMVHGRTDPFTHIYIDGYHGNRWFGAEHSLNSDLMVYNNKGWQKMVGRFTLPTRTGMTQCNFVIFCRDFTGTVSFRNVKLERGTVATDHSPAPEELATATRVTQLANSYAISLLRGDSDVLTAITMATGGIGMTAGNNKLVVTPDTTFIQDGTIKNAMIETLHGGKIMAGSITSTILAAEAVTADKLKVDQALFNKLMANEAYLRQLFAQQAFITQVQAVTISADQIQGGVLSAINGAVSFNLNQAQLDFNSNATINFNASNNALVRKRGTHTGFVHFADESKGGVYASIGVTSSGDGVNSSSSGRFAGIRAFRTASGGTWSRQHTAAVDQLEIYGDAVYISDDFSVSRGFRFRPDVMGGVLDMNNLYQAVVECALAIRDLGQTGRAGTIQRLIGGF